MKIEARAALLAAWLLPLAACSSSGSGGYAPDGGPSGGGSGGGSGGLGGMAGQSALGGSGGASDPNRSVCDAYLECASQTTPEGLAAVIAAYGSNGSCWLQGDAELCANACRTGLVAAHKAFPEVEACNSCASDADCPSSVPACDPAAHRCVACLGDSDCGNPALPGCDSTQHVCVSCTQNAHCKNPDAPVCDVASSTCVGCATNSDCAGSLLGPVCDAASKHCRGCNAGSECASGACQNGGCVQCTSDAQCGGATPHCAPNGTCIQCQTDSECAPGLCFLGSCCGQTACADASAECGMAIDLKCLFTPIECGACGAGQVCLTNHCNPAPPKNCACSGGNKCTYVPEDNAYECLPLFTSCSSTQPCDKGFFCSEFQVNGNTYRECRVQCLNDADCASGSCKLLEGPTSYGYCG